MGTPLEFDPEHVVRIEIGDVLIDKVNRTVTRNGVPMKLTSKEFDMLTCLAIYKGRVASRTQILQYLYGRIDVERMSSVRVFLTYVRKHIERAGLTWRIASINGGYKLIVPAETRHTVVCSPLSSLPTTPT
jgi:DNA-binding response OmpR family regulator